MRHHLNALVNLNCRKVVVRPFSVSSSLRERKKSKSDEPFLNKHVFDAAKGVAEALGNEQVEKDLLGKLQGLAEDKKRESVDLPRLRTVLSDMKIELPRSDRPPRTEGLPANLSRSSDRLMRKPRPADSWTELKSIFEGQPLGIFKKDDLPQTQSKGSASLFSRLVAEENKCMSRTFPRNAFEEQIQWTEDGKLWQFPIDNEYAWPEENDTSFVDHIFIERLLNEPQYTFPKTGPVRHFMELVCNGLSKNAFMTAKEKRSIVGWFSDYFKDKYAIVDRAVAESEKAKAKEVAASGPRQ